MGYKLKNNQTKTNNYHQKTNQNPNKKSHKTSNNSLVQTLLLFSAWSQTPKKMERSVLLHTVF